MNDGLESPHPEWILTASVLLPDSRRGTMMEIFYPTPDGGFQWKSTSRMIADTPLPDLGPLAAKKSPVTIKPRILTSPLPTILEADE